MVLRGLVGAGAGFLAGVGFVLSLDEFRLYCDAEPLPAGCGGAGILLILLIFAGWMLVAGVLIHVGFRLAHTTRGWVATGVGSALWVLLIVAFLYFRSLSHHHSYQVEDRIFLLNAVAVLACVAYAVAALGTGRRRTA